MGHGGNPVRQAKRRAVGTGEQVDRERGRESEEAEGAVFRGGRKFSRVFDGGECLRDG